MTLGLTYRLKDLKLLDTGLEVRLDFPKDFLEKELASSDIDLSRSAANFLGELRFLSDDHVECRGTLTAVFGLTCHRCLEPTQVTEETPVDALFVPQMQDENASDGGDSFDMDRDTPAEVFYHHGEFVDLEPMFREHLVLALPIKVLCKEDCLGLCPVCGGNKNLVVCKCKGHTGFSPFEKLKKLLR